MLLDCVLMLLCRGCELSALAFLKDYLAGADHAIVRRCVTTLLRLAQPPYSDAFARALLAVLQLPHVLAALRPAAAADRVARDRVVQRRQPRLARRVVVVGTELFGGRVGVEVLALELL